jgi:signal transduction histidine kinase
MFPAELTTVFANLLTNAVKAARAGGQIRAMGRQRRDGETVIRIENTGRAVKLDRSERLFLPFVSTTTEVDPVLGQGMGLGLTITRGVLDEYGATINFVEPRHDFATALEIVFPGKP